MGELAAGEDEQFEAYREAGIAMKGLPVTIRTVDIGAIAAFFGMSNRIVNFASIAPNDDFYLMGRLPKG